MGALLVNSGQNEAAGEEFKKAIAADPNYADAQYQYGVYLTSKATTDASGKIVAAPGTIEALQKYLDLKPDGPFAQSAKELIAELGGTVSTTSATPTRPAQQEEVERRSKARPRARRRRAPRVSCFAFLARLILFLIAISVIRSVLSFVQRL